MSPSLPPSPPLPPSRVGRWLLSLYLLVGVMVAVGGTTRLTGSGLSITEWRPIMGTLPPLTAEAWEKAFDLYKATPQFQQVNHWMSLSDFQGIFFWEYVHRLLGRVIGLVFFVPFVWFVAKRELRGGWAKRAAVAFVLGGLQGALGWFMVASGLVNEPRVSHFRLAAHLGLAFFVSQYLLWLWLDLRAARGSPRAGEPQPSSTLAIVGFVALLSLQIVYGAFMAGAKAGYLFSSFPDMNGEYFPSSANWHSDPVGIHFVHRSLGWLVAAAGMAVAWRLREKLLGQLIGLGVLAQFALGVATVLTSVRAPIAVAHQVGAWVLLSLGTAALHQARVEAKAAASALPTRTLLEEGARAEYSAL
jgi:cytochrome c oxidase assembly protein subunit 15